MTAPGPAAQPAARDYAALVRLFEQWRAFTRPALRNGVPDYGASAIAARAAALPEWRARLAAIDPTGWPLAQRTDHRLVEAEMNGLDFDLRVLRPWARDPAFYVSIWPERTDVPSREAPVSEPEIELYAYRFPLDPAAQRELADRIGIIPAFLAAAKVNLAGSTARDLWVYGALELRKQARALAALEQGTLTVSTLEGSQQATLDGASTELRAAVGDARRATEEFVAWLDSLAPTRTGPSGVGKEHYTWYQRHVHLVPHTWDEQVVLLRRELARAHASLALEEHRNRALPPLEPVRDAAAYDRLTHERLATFVRFLAQRAIVPDTPYLVDALAPRLGQFVPPDRQAFFDRVMQREPMLMLSHDYHWIDLARMRDEPNASPIRRVPSLSNIWDSRAEGFATAFEEILMHAGLYDDEPRARELVWIMLANRAARGLASLLVHANEMTLDEAGRFQADWTPRGWANAADALTAFEQLLYLRQPGYGTSYVVGKLMLDDLLMKYRHREERAGRPFVLRDFVDRMNAAGMIPLALIEPELVGPDAGGR